MTKTKTLVKWPDETADVDHATEIKTLIIRIVRDEAKGGWICIDDNGDKPFEGRVHASYEDALSYLDAAYGPSKSVWHPRRVPGGYEIDID